MTIEKLRLSKKARNHFGEREAKWFKDRISSKDKKESCAMNPPATSWRSSSPPASPMRLTEQARRELAALLPFS
jgi:hypothetical protein